MRRKSVVEEGLLGWGCVLVASIRKKFVCMTKGAIYHLEEGVKGEEWGEKREREREKER